MTDNPTKNDISIWRYFLLGAVIVVMPMVFLLLLSKYQLDSFHANVSENKDLCIERAEKEKRPREMCFEAAQQAKEAYTGATGSSIPTLLIVLGINLGLAYSILGLRQKVQQLQQRLDA